MSADTAGTRDGGIALAGRLRPFNRKRDKTLLRYEHQGGLSDYGFLIGPVCVVESELVRVFGEPARRVQADLIELRHTAGNGA